MTVHELLSTEDLAALRRKLQHEYDAFRSRGLTLDLTRGKPSPEQLEFSSDLLSLPEPGDFLGEGRTDTRNYGGLQGLAEARRLFSGLLGAPAGQIVVGNNSSLALMHDVIVFALLKGTAEGSAPWSKQGEIAFLCPVPGYDRHFKICEDYGIRMIPVPLLGSGPDMDAVERLASQDPSIKGMWCVPKYSNPTGDVYSNSVIERLAAMKTAAADFRLFWDNAYGVHHLTGERLEIANILERCAHYGNANRPFVFASTSKITLAGAGLALFAASEDNVRWLLARLTPRTIGPDKINQLRHVRFLKDHAGILRLMEKHRGSIAPKFQRVLDVLDSRLSGRPEVRWSRPKGGYFLTLDVPEGCARKVVALARQAGLALTPAGATHPHGHDPEDRTIRIAPTFPDPASVTLAAEGVAVCVLLASAEREAERRTGSPAATA